MTEKKTRLPRKGVILPPEHGSWGMIGEPLLLGLLIYPAGVSLSISVFSFAMFLLRVPLLRLWKARRMSTPDPQRKLVVKFLVWVGVVALLSLGGTFVLTQRFSWLWPLAMAAPLAFGALRDQNRGRTRHLFPEILAAVAIGAPVTSILLANGFPLLSGFALWGLIACKSIGSILFVRTQIRRSQQRPSGRGAMLLVNVLLILPASVLGMCGGLPALTLWVMPSLAIRAWGLSMLPVRSAKQVGWIEVGVTLLFVMVVGLSF